VKHIVKQDYSGSDRHQKLKTGPVKITSLFEFAQGKVCAVRKYSSTDKKYTPFEIVKRAKSRVGEEKYDIFFNNCEHFAEWCCTGVENCHQFVSWLDTRLVNNPNLRKPFFYVSK
jgi:hypothetical protein